MDLWQKQMIRSLFHYSTVHMDIERAFMVKHQHVPAHLYKYRQFKKEHLEALEQGVLWVSSPDRLNDTFEAWVRFDADRLIMDDVSGDEFVSVVKEIGRVQEEGGYWQAPTPKNPITSGEWRRKRYDEFLRDTNMPKKEEFAQAVEAFSKKQAEAQIKAMTDSFRAGFSVLSLSATATSKVLWAHYAHSHTGFAIEYDFAALPYSDLRRRLCFPVFYTKKLRDATRYIANQSKPHNNLFGQFMCLIKEDEWGYEQEWRIIHAIGPDNANFAMSMPTPSAILMGSHVSDENERTMREFCSRRSIVLKRMVQTTGSFGLRPEPVDLA